LRSALDRGLAVPADTMATRFQHIALRRGLWQFGFLCREIAFLSAGYHRFDPISFISHISFARPKGNTGNKGNSNGFAIAST
jgi:hypothetical protein